MLDWCVGTSFWLGFRQLTVVRGTGARVVARAGEAREACASDRACEGEHEGPSLSRSQFPASFLLLTNTQLEHPQKKIAEKKAKGKDPEEAMDED